MILQYIDLITTLGVIIILILLLVIIPMLISIKTRQRKINDALIEGADNIEKLAHTISIIEKLVSDNFKEVLAKELIRSSNYMTISDMLKDIADGIVVLKGQKTSNKPRRSRKPPMQTSTAENYIKSTGSRRTR